MDRQCSSCGGFCKKSGCERENVKPKQWVWLTDDDIHDAFNYVEMVKLLDFDRDRPEWCEAFARACEARLRHRNGEKQ